MASPKETGGRSSAARKSAKTASRARKARATRLTAALGAFVVLCTAWALMVPAITLTIDRAQPGEGLLDTDFEATTVEGVSSDSGQAATNDQASADGSSEYIDAHNSVTDSNEPGDTATDANPATNTDITAGGTQIPISRDSAESDDSNNDERDTTLFLHEGETVSLEEALVKIGAVEQEDAGDYVRSISSVEFSNPEVAAVDQIIVDTTAGELKDYLGVSSEYSSELTETRVAAMDAKELTAPDWAIVSLKPFEPRDDRKSPLAGG